jgi:hypothetical protein
MIINIIIADMHNLRIGWISVDQYFMLVALLSKPWTKTLDIGFGGLLAYVYHHIHKYRETPPSRERNERFRVVHHLMTSKYLGKALLLVGLSLILMNLLGGCNYFENP